jgi:hypothetical protein
MDSNDSTLRQYLRERRNQKKLSPNTINTRPISQEGVPEVERMADPIELYDQACSKNFTLKRNPPHVVVEAK